MIEPALDAEGIRSALESAGWKCTPQRLAVYECLRCALHHPTAEEVYQRVQVRIPKISLATVYKALETLVASGLASKLPAADGSARYDARREHHYHARCLRSGAVQDLETPFDPGLIEKLDPNLRRLLAEQGFQVTGYRLELVGYVEEPDRAAAHGAESKAGA
jgi:Fe2+ or Zn2+ uptake regulation protein